MAKESVAERRTASDDGQPIQERAAELMRGASDTVRDTASTVAAHAPEAIQVSQAAIDEASRRLQTSSDEALALGTAFSFGLWLGMLVGGAPRLLTMAALIPAMTMGGTLLARRPDMVSTASRRKA